MSLLEVNDLRKTFGGLVALDGVSMEIEAGEVVGLIGPNGAGKTTLFHCVSGVLDPDGGRVAFEGREVTDAPPHALARHGLVRTYQQTRELTTLSVRASSRR
ncbi:MAG: ATP-binding cassette domain-containing protein [Halobacteriales archaeon]